MKGLGKLVFLLIVGCLIAADATAQCSMCRAVAESQYNSLAEGLNNGILYLMGIPYMLLIGSAIYLFRKPKS
ncbi:MAG: hypothetical protein ACFB10_23955 [Salibacteraceae bacterium]